MNRLVKLLGKAFSGGATHRGAPARSDTPVYAIGDVHGRSDLLEPLMESILRDALRDDPDGTAAKSAEVVFIGDAIDRGPDSRGTLEFMMAVAEWPEVTPIFLRGNHEAMMQAFLHDPVRNANWMSYGGYETMLSYGMTKFGRMDDRDDLLDLADRFRRVLSDHLDFVERFQLMHRNGNVVFVHAAADPELPIEVQTEDVLLWGCETFETKPRTDDIWVVHGHTIVDAPAVRAGRISIDTGAYASHALTAVKIDGLEVSFLTERSTVHR